ncbi:hypothetical protein PG994_015119 [Apiospora phragmitis]|uniref:Uncharacterized protein n=1 Tax=Apiospora phragmitis TaxID=2905665 RepID=A0ABR1SVK3_9PEZI
MRASLFAFSIRLPYAMAVMNFISPPRYGTMRDYRSNVEYPIGYNLSITWTPGVAGRKASLQLYQVNLTSGSIFFGEAETVTEDMVDLTAWKWPVSTGKDLSVSNMFQLALWDEGKDTYDDWCHYFNITTGGDSDAAPSGATAPTTPAPTTTTPPNRPTAGPPSEAATSTSSSEPEQKKDWTGMSTGAKITVGVILPIVAIAGFLVGWCVLGRQRRRRQQQEAAAAAAATENAQWQAIPKYAAEQEQWPPQEQWPQQGQWPPQEQLPPQELPLSHDRHQIDDSPRRLHTRCQTHRYMNCQAHNTADNYSNTPRNFKKRQGIAVTPGSRSAWFAMVVAGPDSLTRPVLSALWTLTAPSCEVGNHSDRFQWNESCF